ncbi:MAG: hypothetical protein H6582_01420 [Crocinitomicaceae bacterium]|nr:hypothetical protein [Crocinitomicaceae bacterium]
MKKVLIAVVVLAGSMSMTSCKKDYTCDCTVSGSTYSLTIPDAKKKDAESACDTWGTLYTLGGGSCELK